MRIVIRKNYEEMSKTAAEIVSSLIKRKPDCILGLATGSTPIGLYKELIRMHKEENLDFSNVKTFNLDEYYGLSPTHPQSYRYFMDENLFNHINIKKENTNIPDGLTKIDEIDNFCENYEKTIKESGGIDLQILGIGRDGHIGFNEPGSPLTSKTRLVALNKQTIKDNSRFFEKIEDVPKFALTMGIGTILEAKEIILLANGKKKSEIIAEAIEGPVTSMVSASFLQFHNRVTVIIDEEAGSLLRRLDYYKFVEEAEKKISKTIF